MKKSILAILVLISGISIVQAEAAQRTAKQPSFFIPEDAMKVKSKPVITGRYSVQNIQNTEKTTKKTGRPVVKLTASKLITPANTKQPKKLTLSAHKNVNTPADETPTNQNIDNIPTAEVAEAKTEQIQFESEIPANTPSGNEIVTNPSEQISDNTINTPQTQAPDIEPNVFQIILNEYYQDTESIDKTHTYQNERLQNVIASFVDEDHILN